MKKESHMNKPLTLFFHMAEGNKAFFAKDANLKFLLRWLDTMPFNIIHHFYSGYGDGGQPEAERIAQADMHVYFVTADLLAAMTWPYHTPDGLIVPVYCLSCYVKPHPLTLYGGVASEEYPLYNRNASEQVEAWKGLKDALLKMQAS